MTRTLTSGDERRPQGDIAIRSAGALYDRRVRVIVHTGDSKGLEFNGPMHASNGKFIEGLQIKFHVVKTLNMHQNMAEITLHNLNVEHRAAIDKANAEFTIEAGYVTTMGMIYKGNAFKTENKADVGQVESVIKAQTGGASLDGLINMSFVPGTEIDKVIKTICDSLKVDAKSALALIQAGKTKEAKQKVLQGLTLQGSAKKQLEKLFKSQGKNWS